MDKLITEFITRGGIATIYPSNDDKHIIRYSLKLEGNTLTGKTDDLASVLRESMGYDGYNIDPLDDEALACVYGYDGPLY